MSLASDVKFHFTTTEDSTLHSALAVDEGIHGENQGLATTFCFLKTTLACDRHSHSCDANIG